MKKEIMSITEIWEEIKKLPTEEIYNLLATYDLYVIDAIDREIVPVCVAEFYTNDYELPRERRRK